MKYVVTWEPLPSVTEEAEARSLQVFSNWAPSEGATFLEFLGRVDNRGGFAVVETDDAALIAKDIAPFGVWFAFGVYPVLEIADSAAVGAGAVAFRASVG
ncbi:DUF3303 domain-containing protein [Nocardioides cavernaquae]|uniref:DUF3303 domain-containing protein n=1 Tax=Nocardioides cavernaquae TaxID=2321396 RepID=A0A3A5H2Y8_9ACTN|nr:DUF3303 family protein [Nocardioides cavernaquae]RJS45149.1 DUF3303 domain-containing protein [Nocardioides cavernaquae]